MARTKKHNGQNASQVKVQRKISDVTSDTTQVEEAPLGASDWKSADTNWSQQNSNPELSVHAPAKDQSLRSRIQRSASPACSQSDSPNLAPSLACSTKPPTRNCSPKSFTTSRNISPKVLTSARSSPVSTNISGKQGSCFPLGKVSLVSKNLSDLQPEESRYLSTDDEDSRIFVFQNVKQAISTLPKSEKTPIVCIKDVLKTESDEGSRSSTPVRSLDTTLNIDTGSCSDSLNVNDESVNLSDKSVRLNTSFRPRRNTNDKSGCINSFVASSILNEKPVTKIQKLRRELKEQLSILNGNENMQSNKSGTELRKHLLRTGCPTMENSEVISPSKDTKNTSVSKDSKDTKKEFGLMKKDGKYIIEVKCDGNDNGQKRCNRSASKSPSKLPSLSMSKSPSHQTKKLSPNGERTESDLDTPKVSPRKRQKGQGKKSNSPFGETDANFSPTELGIQNNEKTTKVKKSPSLKGKESSPEESSLLRVSPISQGKDGENIRQGRRIRSPSLRYADDMILFPLKSPRRSPKGNTPPKDSDNTLSDKKCFTKTTECQTSELYALLTKSLGGENNRSKSPVASCRSSTDALTDDSGNLVNKTVYGNANNFVERKSSGAVREINFTEQLKNDNKCDSQIQVSADDVLNSAEKPSVDIDDSKKSVDNSVLDNNKETDSEEMVKHGNSKTDGMCSVESVENDSKESKFDCVKDKTESKTDMNIVEESVDISCHEKFSDITEEILSDDNKQIKKKMNEGSKNKSGSLFNLISKVKCNLESVTDLPDLLVASPFYDSVMLDEEQENYSSDSCENSPKCKEIDHNGQGSVDYHVPSSNLDNGERKDNGSTSASCSDKVDKNHLNMFDKVKKDLADIEKLGLVKKVANSNSNEQKPVVSESKRSDTVERITSQHGDSNDNVSSSKRPIATADIILVDSATSSSDDIVDKSENQNESKEPLAESLSSSVVTSDADSTTVEFGSTAKIEESNGCSSPVGRNIFDLIMNDYQSPVCESKAHDAQSLDMKSKSFNSASKVDKSDVSNKRNGEDTDHVSDCVVLSDEDDIEKADETCDKEKFQDNMSSSSVDPQQTGGIKHLSNLSILERIQEKLNPPEENEEMETEETKKEETKKDEKSEKGVIDLTGQSDESDEDSHQPVKKSSTTQESCAKIREPKSLDVLKRVELDNVDKMSAFQSKKLDSYLESVYNRGRGSRKNSKDYEDNEGEEEEENEDDEIYEDEIDPDFDEVDGVLFMSFPSHEALTAHMVVERKTDIGRNDNLLLGMCRMKNLKEKQKLMEMKNRFIKRPKVNRLKKLKIQSKINQNLRGMHKALEKYQKIFKKELYNILVEQNNDSELEPPKKTSDITKIKGWKKKFGNAEELAEATGLSLSQAGRLHWRTEARLVKHLKPNELKEMGLNLKKKRRKNLIFTQRKGMSKGDRGERHGEGEEASEDGQLDEDNKKEDGYISEYEEDYHYRDNMEFEVGESETLVEHEEKKSQSKLKADRIRKRILLKKLNFGPEEETILRRLGGQRALKKSHFQGLNMDVDTPQVSQTLPSQDEVVEESDNKIKRRRRRKKGDVIQITTLTQSMAYAALSALDGRFFTEKPVKQIVVKQTEGDKIPPKPQPKTVKKEADDSQENLSSYKAEDSLNQGDLEDCGEQCNRPGQTTTSTSCYNGTINPLHDHTTSVTTGCRYGCICHLCKFAEGASSEDGEPTAQTKTTKQSTTCDKEYCRLGCICDSLGARREQQKKTSHCGKTECMLECVCKNRDTDEGLKEDKPAFKHSKQLEKLLTQPETKKLSSPDPDTVKQVEVEDDKGKKKGKNQKKFDALPKRESTYRLAKNLDAISRKAMLLYETSEMYTEQTTKRRKKKDIEDEGQPPQKSPGTGHDMSFPDDALSRTRATAAQHCSPVLPPATAPGTSKAPKSQATISSAGKDGKSSLVRSQRKLEDPEEMFDKVYEFDDITFDEMLESDTEDTVEEFTTCARTTVYNPVKRVKQKCTCGKEHVHDHAEKSELGADSSPIVISPTPSPPPSPIEVSDVMEEKKVNKENVTKKKKTAVDHGTPKVTAVDTGAQKVTAVDPGAQKATGASAPAVNTNLKAVRTGWHTQWVCLKTSKKKSEDDEMESYELRLLEMISNCNWENCKQKILSKVSAQISKESYPSPKQMEVGNYVVEFLPKSDKAAVIPPEVKAKLPPSIFSIRIKVERKLTKEEKMNQKLNEVISDNERVLKQYGWPRSETSDNSRSNPTTVTSRNNYRMKVNSLLNAQAKQFSAYPSASTAGGIVASTTGGISALGQFQINHHEHSLKTKNSSGGALSENSGIGSLQSAYPSASTSGGISALSQFQINRHENSLKTKNSSSAALSENSGIGSLQMGEVRNYVIKPSECGLPMTVSETCENAKREGSGSGSKHKNVLFLQDQGEGKKVLCVPPNIPLTKVQSLLSPTSKVLKMPAVPPKQPRLLAPAPAGGTSVTNSVVTTSTAGFTGKVNTHVVLEASPSPITTVSAGPIVLSGTVPAGVVSKSEHKTSIVSTVATLPGMSVAGSFKPSIASVPGGSVVTTSVLVPSTASKQGNPIVKSAVSLLNTAPVRGNSVVAGIMTPAVVVPQSSPRGTVWARPPHMIGNLSNVKVPSTSSTTMNVRLSGPGNTVSGKVIFTPILSKGMVFTNPGMTKGQVSSPFCGNESSKTVTKGIDDKRADVVLPVSHLAKDKGMVSGKKSPTQTVVCPISSENSVPGSSSNQLLYGPFNNIEDIPKNLKNARVLSLNPASQSSSLPPNSSAPSLLSPVVLPITIEKDTSGIPNIPATSKDNETKSLDELKSKNVSEKTEKNKESDELFSKEGLPVPTGKQVLYSKSSKEIGESLFSYFRMGNPKKIPKRKYKKREKMEGENNKRENTDRKEKKKRKRKRKEASEQQAGVVEQSEQGESVPDKKKRKKKRKRVENSEGQETLTSADTDGNLNDKNGNKKKKRKKRSKSIGDGDICDGSIQDEKRVKGKRKKDELERDGDPQSAKVILVDEDNAVVKEKNCNEGSKGSSTVNSESPPRKKSRGQAPDSNNSHSLTNNTEMSTLKIVQEEELSQMNKNQGSDEVDGGKRAVNCAAASGESVVCSDKGLNDSHGTEHRTQKSKALDCDDGIHCDNDFTDEEVANIQKNRDVFGHGYKWPSPVDKTGKVCHLGVWIDEKDIPEISAYGDTSDCSSDSDDCEEKKSVLSSVSSSSSSCSSSSSSSSSSCSSSSSSSCSSPSVLSENRDIESEKDSLNDSLNEKLLENVQSVCDEVCCIVEKTKSLAGASHPLLEHQSEDDEGSQFTVEGGDCNNEKISISSVQKSSEPLDLHEKCSNETSTIGSKNLEVESKKTSDNVSCVVISDIDSPQKSINVDTDITVKRVPVTSLLDDDDDAEKVDLAVPTNTVKESSTPNQEKGDLNTEKNDDGIEDDVIIIEDNKADGDTNSTKVSSKEASCGPKVTDGVTGGKAKPVMSSHPRGSEGAAAVLVDVDSFTEEEDIDIESLSDVEIQSPEKWRSQMLTGSGKHEQQTCSVHHHIRRKRKSNLQTIDNVLQDDMEFREAGNKKPEFMCFYCSETSVDKQAILKHTVTSHASGLKGLIKTYGPQKRDSSMGRLVHLAKERQRRTDLKTGFASLIEVLFGRNEHGGDIPLSVEDIHNTSKTKILHKAQVLIEELIKKQQEKEAKKKALTIQRNVLIQRLYHARGSLIQIGMSPARIQDILFKIKRTCQFIFDKREMLVKKRLATLKAAMELCSKSDSCGEEENKKRVQSEPIQSIARTASHTATRTSKSSPDPQLSQQFPIPINVLLNPMKAANGSPVPVQLVSSQQVLKMAEYNKVEQDVSDHPEIYIDMAEDEEEMKIKSEPQVDDVMSLEQASDLALGGIDSPSGSWSVYKADPGSDNEAGNSDGGTVQSYSRANVQSPVFSDVDETEGLMHNIDNDFVSNDRGNEESSGMLDLNTGSDSQNFGLTDMESGLHEM